MTRPLWIAFGLTALSLGAIGVVLPLLPTTPFLLLAAFAFARSSPRLHSWLLGHRLFGPFIENWHRHGAISRRVKIVSALSMAAVFGVSLALGVSGWVLAVQALALGASALFVLTRPEGPAVSDRDAG
ncbi:YbaN family protein [Sandaracinobacteroides saxicola]|uniref:YbaN family protein n=1 Tax=Sandaracinobacteroides saxicola TaxID=2759707 RepID=UPI001A9C375A|nr:YbaN family protein [Sandaracinobacteroides saxicola]